MKSIEISKINKLGLRSRALRLIGFVVLLCCPLIFQSCGGGVSGTGDIQVTTVQGRVANLDGASVAGAQVSLVETGDSDITDETGAFSFETAAITGEINIAVKTDNVEASTLLVLLDEPVSQIDVELAVDAVNNTVTVVSKSIPPTPTAIPTTSLTGPPLPDHGSNPTPTPTFSANPPPVEPTAIPTIAPTPTVEITPIVETAIYKGQVIVLGTGAGAADGAIVQIVGTSDTTVVDSGANFYLETDPEGARFITVQYQGRTGTGVFTAVPPGSARVCLTINLTFTLTPLGAPGLRVSTVYQDVTDGSTDCTPDLSRPQY